jgi:hypothetical protein
MASTETAFQPLDSGYESSEGYDELLLILALGKNTSSAFTFKIYNTVHKGGTESGSLQPMLDSLHIRQNYCQNLHREDEAKVRTLTSHLPTFSNMTARNEDPHGNVSNFFQISTALPSTLRFALHPDQCIR